MLRARLQTLETMGLAGRTGAHTWRVSPRLESTLTALGERGDILRTMHKALRGQPQEHVIAAPQPGAQTSGRFFALVGGYVII